MEKFSGEKHKDDKVLPRGRVRRFGEGAVRAVKELLSPLEPGPHTLWSEGGVIEAGRQGWQSMPDGGPELSLKDAYRSAEDIKSVYPDKNK